MCEHKKKLKLSELKKYQQNMEQYSSDALRLEKSIKVKILDHVNSLIFISIQYLNKKLELWQGQLENSNPFSILLSPIATLESKSEHKKSLSVNNISMDSLNDKPTDPKYAFMAYLATRSDENIQTLIPIAIKHLFDARKNKCGSTVAAFENCLDNMPSEFWERNSEAEIIRI